MLSTFALQSTLHNRSTILRILHENIDAQRALIIPHGLKNNIAWQLGHIMSVQQGLIYGLSGLPMKLPMDFIQKFKKGTLPNDQIPPLEELVSLFTSTLKEVTEDYHAGRFTQYKPFQIFTGVQLTNVDEAIQFNMAHEMYHMGQTWNILNLILGSEGKPTVTN